MEGAGGIKRVLFVCHGNTCRSPMAAVLARQLLGPEVEIQSAGVGAYEGTPAAQEAVTVMAERGIDLGAHRARRVDSFDLHSFDLVVAMDPGVAAQLRARGVDPAKLVELDIPDPIGQGTDAYHETAEMIASALQGMFRLGGESQQVGES